MGIIYEPKGPAREYSELAANLYKGCPHSCTYCYVPGIPPWVFKPNPQQLFHGCRDPRPNLLKQLERDCRKFRGDPREILLCFTCDPYCHGMDNSLTREALLIMEQYDLRVQVLTKGGMAAAGDFDILARNDWKFASTLLFTSDELRQKWEPGTASVQSRIEAIRLAHSMGIETWISMEPVIDPQEALGVIEALKGDVDLWKVGKLNHMPVLEAKVDWAQFLRDVRSVLGGENYIIKEDLLTYGN